MKKTVFLLVALFILLGTAMNVRSMPAKPEPIKFTQPDGTVITIMLKGDEKVSWSQTIDGYTLMRNDDGFLTYAMKDVKGNLQPSTVIATDMASRDFKANSILSGIEKGLFYSEGQVSMMLEMWDAVEDQYKSSKASEISSEGKKNILVALVGFSEGDGFKEEPFQKTKAEFHNLLNQLGYSDNGGKGSVKDWFLETSYGKLDLTFTVAGPYLAPKSEYYYTGGKKNTRCPMLAKWILEQIDADGYDLSNLDSDGDGIADCFHFVYAGNGQEATGIDGTIWSHKSNVSGMTGFVVGGMRFVTYSCSSERNSNSKTAMSTIGVICHEMTHVFGAPDYYDTDYQTGGEFPGTSNWDVMGSGGYNGSPSGSAPACHNMYQKIKFGWVIPEELSEAKSVYAMPNSNEHPVAYKISTTTPDEYFVLENRQRLNFDRNTPSDGLLIYRIHSSMKSYTGNSLNAKHPQKVYPVCSNATEAIPTSTPSSYGNPNSQECPFPGNGEKTSFTDETVPSTKSWANVNTDKPITNIRTNDTAYTVSFDFMGGVTSDCSTPKNLTMEYVIDNGITLTWEAPDNGQMPDSYNVYKNNVILKEGVLTLTYKDEDNKKANHTYYITAKFGDCESAPSNTMSLLVPTLYTINALSSNESAGSVTGVGEYKKGNTVKLRAVPVKGNIFSYWLNEDGDKLSTTALYQFSAMRNMDLKAVFNAQTGVENVDMTTDIRVFAANGSINIAAENNSGNMLIDIIDLNGRVIKNATMSGNTMKIAMENKGVYIVRIISNSKVFSSKVVF